MMQKLDQGTISASLEYSHTVWHGWDFTVAQVPLESHKTHKLEMSRCCVRLLDPLSSKPLLACGSSLYKFSRQSDCGSDIPEVAGEPGLSYLKAVCLLCWHWFKNDDAYLGSHTEDGCFVFCLISEWGIFCLDLKKKKKGRLLRCL